MWLVDSSGFATASMKLGDQGLLNLVVEAVPNGGWGWMTWHGNRIFSGSESSAQKAREQASLYAGLISRSYTAEHAIDHCSGSDTHQTSPELAPEANTSPYPPYAKQNEISAMTA